MKFYLAGPVGYGIPGVEWKSGIKQLLRWRGHEVYDPIENDHKYPLVSKMNFLKEHPRKNAGEIKQIMQEIFIDDCAFISECDYLICYFVNKAYGTISEQGIAYYLRRLLGKKVQTICLFDESFTPDEWTLCCADHLFFVRDKFQQFLEEIS